MSVHLTIERHVGKAGVLLKLRGSIDETLTSEELASTAEVTVIDLDNVVRISSFGVRAWLRAAELWRGYVAFINCRPALVTHFNTVARFAGRGHLLSFYAPYICLTCGSTFDVFIDIGEDYAAISAGQPPARTCPRCRAAAELDDMPEVFFAFAASHPKPTPPPEFEAILSGVAAPRAVPTREVLHLQQEVEDRATLLWLSGPLNKRARLARTIESLEGNVLLVLQGITLLDGDGVNVLASFALAPATFLAFARVPAAVYNHVGREVLDSLPIASFHTPVRCSTCGDSFTIEHSGEPVVCASCGALLPVPALRANRVLPPELVSVLALRTGPRAPERSFLERFDIIRLLGSGGMAEVFLAKMSAVGGFRKLVALKRIHPSLKRSPESTAMFLAEARLAARLNHPNIVQVLDIGVEAGDLYLAMEFVRGIDLRTALAAAREHPLSVAVALKICSDLCAALAAAHGYVDEDQVPRPIVHRDISPPNTLLSIDGNVKLSDFGIAKVAGEDDTTPPSVWKGKLTYLAPEVIQRVDEAADPRSDLFAVGLMLFQCLSGYHPFVRANRFDTLSAILNEPLPSLVGLRDGLDAQIDSVLQKACAKRLDDRYQTAADLKLALDGLLQQTQETQPAEALARWITTVASAAIVPADDEALFDNSATREGDDTILLGRSRK